MGLDFREPQLEIALKRVIDVYGFRNSLQKADSYNTMNPWPGVSTSATTINKAQHKPLRRTVARGLSTANLVGFEGALNNVIDHFCTILLKGPRDDQGWAEPRNMANYSECFTLWQMFLN